VAKQFKGTINVDIRDSEPDWTPFEPPKAPPGAPNVVYIVLDDVGFSALSCYGGPVPTPNIDRIAAHGVRYTQWHTTALCSPTRSCLLTGRNHTRNSMACITEAAIGFPNASGTIPPENGMLPEILAERGWNTYLVGKWHLCPTDEMHLAATRRNWPSGRGTERFYGFLGAETNQWYPDLVYDNHPVDPPRSPDEGYHLTDDITDKALEFIKDAKAVAPEKPFFLYYAIDIVPTVLDLLGVDPPEILNGHTQSYFDGVSMRGSIDDGSAPSTRKTQFYAMLGSRAIWHEGWKAVTTHPCIAGWGHFNDDTWELYHTDFDRAELHDLAAENPEKLRELVALWFAEAGANGAFPLDDRSAVEILSTARPQLTAPRSRYTYFPGTAPVPEWQAVSTRNRSFVIGAVVDITAPPAEGVLFAMGSRFGGHALYVKNGRLHYVNNFLGIEEQQVAAREDIPAGDDLILTASFEKEEQRPDCAIGTLTLYRGDREIGQGRIKTQLGAFAIAGSGLNVGRDPGEPITADYSGEPPYAFTGGTINRIVIDVSGDPYLDLEREAALMLMRE
jgi:hypothetical protein